MKAIILAAMNLGLVATQSMTAVFNIIVFFCVCYFFSICLLY